MTESKPRGVPAASVRAHLQRYVAQGATAEWIAERAGVSERTVRSVLAGQRPSLYAGTAHALMQLHGTPGPSARVVDPGPTVARLHELIDRHWPVHAIADMAGLSHSTLMPSNLTNGVTEQTEQAVRIVHERLGDRDGPAPRAYPWLAQRLEAHRPSDIRDGAGLSFCTARRVRAGLPVRRKTAVAVLRWLNSIAARPS
ncbi:hypothetical protein [Pseudactinotalea terrae]|uniref:hypothetical protein n=1 Tax=Pseudactinotalea terrae TaxID=1743262 RepID=UPI0012E2281A|nr:hypothetical protein [Pseudactinotalea terrae]